jgi:hydroxymethylpyrimidine/phosphomethylpyrimidine kinase
MKNILILSGHDPSGGAGMIQDSKCVLSFGYNPITIPTVLTIQTGKETINAIGICPDYFKNCLYFILDKINVSAVKIGLINNLEKAHVIRSAFCNTNIPIVYDPVFTSSSGYNFLDKEIYFKIVETLFPLCSIVTPNISELEILTTKSIVSIEDLKNAIISISKLGPKHIIAKGFKVKENISRDVFYYNEGDFLYIDKPIIKSSWNHGTGCTYSSVLVCKLNEGIVNAFKFASNYMETFLSYEATYNHIDHVLNNETLTMEKIKTLNEIKHGILLFKKANLISFIPEVGSNIAQIQNNGKRITDVATLPTRIVKVSDKIESFLSPAFGINSHMSRFVLACNKFDKKIKSAMNIKYSDKLIHKIKKLNISNLEIDRTGEPREKANMEGQTINWIVRKVRAKLKYLPQIIYDKGAHGKEPMIRVLGENAIQVVNTVIDISK